VLPGAPALLRSTRCSRPLLEIGRTAFVQTPSFSTDGHNFQEYFIRPRLLSRHGGPFFSATLLFFAVHPGARETCLFCVAPLLD